MTRTPNPLCLLAPGMVAQRALMHVLICSDMLPILGTDSSNKAFAPENRVISGVYGIPTPASSKTRRIAFSVVLKGPFDKLASRSLKLSFSRSHRSQFIHKHTLR